VELSWNILKGLLSITKFILQAILQLYCSYIAVTLHILLNILQV